MSFARGRTTCDAYWEKSSLAHSCLKVWIAAAFCARGESLIQDITKNVIYLNWNCYIKLLIGKQPGDRRNKEMQMLT